MSIVSQQRAATRTAARAGSVPWVLLSYLGIGLVALLLRVLDLGIFLSHDEANFWIRRSYTFLNELTSGDYAQTAISTHPGVITMWLGSLGIMLLDWLSDSGLLQNYQTSVTLGLIRLPVALMHVAGILVSYGMLRRLLPATVAALAALLWATDPFFIAYSRVLHVDALAGTFATPSLLAACLYWHHTRHPGRLVLSGVCAGLAIMSKSPALLLVPMAGLIALADMWRQRHQAGWFRQGTLALIGWGAACGLTMVALWPAVWANPAAVIEQLRVGVVVEGAQPHQLGNFYLGEANEAPGWTFYLVSTAMRLTPWAMLGLLLLPPAWWRFPAPAPARRDLAVLACFFVLFVLAMSFFPKRFNRYLIPAWPPVNILAAAGLVWGALATGGLLRRILRAGAVLAQRTTALLLSGVTLVAVINAFWWHPYSMTYFNQALGGAKAGAYAFQIGWGEGFNLVADWLNAQPDITGVATISRMVEVLNPYMKEGAQASPARGPDPLQDAGYIVVYVRSVQEGPPSPPFDQFYRQAIPAHTVRIHGVEYAWIYEVPPRLEEEVPADFGPHIHLRGFDWLRASARGQQVQLQLTWETRQLTDRNYWLFAHLLGPDGQRYEQIDMPYPTTDWTPGRFVKTNLLLNIPANAPAGTYRVLIGLYDPESGQRLPLTSEHAADPVLGGANALLLTRLELE